MLKANSFHARPIGGRGAKIGALFIAPSSIESDGARMTDRKFEYFGTVGWEGRSAVVGQANEREDKWNSTGIPRGCGG